MYSTILLALDGSEFSLAGGETALTLAQRLGSRIVACHVYGAQLHNSRFMDMESGLEAKYQDENLLRELRQTHSSLIVEGLEALSRGYMDRFLEDAQKAGIQAAEVSAEGRNYSKILEAARDYKADLIVLGAHGLGNQNDGLLGSTAVRVLHHASCDVFIARKAISGGRVVVGIDGSEEALAALRKAAVWSRSLDADLSMVAVYDPFFHSAVFKTMACSLSPERKEEVGLSRQEDLHERIIDSGLHALYAGFLDRAREITRALNVEARADIIKGKAYRALVDYLDGNGATLAVVGRHGHHRETISTLGSNAEAIVRLSRGNVLVTASGQAAATPSQRHAPGIDWDEKALARLDRVPSFARPMARKGVEDHVRSKGESRVTLQLFLEFSQKIGMFKEKT